MTAICDDLRKAVLQAAIQGKLTQQLPEDGNAEDLYKEIQAEKQKLIKEGKIKKEKPLPEIAKKEISFCIPENWKWCRIGEIFDLRAGKNIAANEIHAEASLDHPYCCFGGNGIRGYVKKHNWEGEHAIIGRQGALCGNVKNANGIFYATEHAVVVTGFAKPCINWQYYFLTALNLNQYATATAQPGLAVAKVNEVLIPLPPLAEQKRIVARVDELMKKIDEMEETEKGITALYEAFPGDMKVALLQAAIQGKLTEQLASDGNAEMLYQEIQKEKQRLVKEGKIKKEKPLPEIAENDIPFDIPENWKWGHLHDVIYHVGNKSNQILAKDIKSEGRYPVISQGANFIDGYCNENLLVHEYPVIMFGDHTKNVKYIDFPFVIGADGTKFLKAILIDSRYLFYWTLFTASQLHDRGYARHYTLLAQTLFPLPPLAEQKRIVEKLDQLLPLSEAMNAEIAGGESV